jgi:nitronate monooxygenase
MAIHPSLQEGLRLPLIAAPMFLVSGPELVAACSRAGVIGTFPALNARTTELFDQWLTDIGQRLAASGSGAPAKYGVNLIVHDSNPRVAADLEVCVRHRVPLIITSLGAVGSLIDRVHSYGGVVLHDVTTTRHARKAAEAGVDGLIAVAAGAGGHAGTWNPFALLSEIRQFFDKTLVLSGALNTGADIAAAQAAGADLAYMGSRFIATRESLASDAYKQMITQSSAADVVYTPAVSGVPGNFLRESLIAAGFDLTALNRAHTIDFGAELGDAQAKKASGAWKEIWSAGQGVGAIRDVPAAPELIVRLKREYAQAVADLQARAGLYNDFETD